MADTPDQNPAPLAVEEKVDSVPFSVVDLENATSVNDEKPNNGPPPVVDEERAYDGPPPDRGPPPPYDSIFGPLKRAQEESDGNMDTIRNVGAVLCCGTVCGILWIVLLLALPIASVVIGAFYLDHCPIQKYIPIYLVVSGAFGIAEAIFKVIGLIIKKKNGDNDDTQKNPNPVACIVHLFLFIWLICGCVWVYGVYSQVQYTPTVENWNNYCHQTVYLFAFWMITLVFIFAGVAILLVCCVPCVLMCISGASN